ncbi:hypothetical protein [Flavobacterium beibuense]|uniref:hypothetical protein n=1 Tax=Flavobacterium beibuense TaxID=657326 RepID=UPI0012F8AFE7|nr:hypothetical protein [Flavobacterium beibuense]
MMDAIFKNWTVIRIVKMIMGILVLYQSIVMESAMLIGLSILLCLIVLLNAGCTSSSCSTHYSSSKRRNSKR